MAKEYQIREYLNGRTFKECYNGVIRQITFETEVEKTQELVVNNETVYVYNGYVNMAELDTSKSQHGWSKNSYKVQGKRRPYITAQKQKFYLDELEIMEHAPMKVTVYTEDNKILYYVIGEKTTFKRK
jgi:hypothetical protein